MTILYFVDKIAVIFETHINRNLRYIHGYTDYVAYNDLITWVSKILGKCYFLNFHKLKKIISFPRTTIHNNCEQNNMLGDILNAGDNFDDQEDYGFRGALFKIAPTVIDN